MDMLTPLIAVIPVLGWGMMPIIAKINGGSPQESLLGTTTFVFSATGIFSLLNGMQYSLDTFLICFSSGFFWGIGQWFQFESMVYIDVSKAMPISNGTQLIFTSLVAWVFLGEWQGLSTGLISIFCLTVMIIGIYYVTEDHSGSFFKQNFRAIGLIFLSSIALTAYVSITQFFGISGSTVFFPQACGMLIFSMGLIGWKREKVCFGVILKNWSTGFSWLLANIALFYAAQKIGLGISFSISQLCVLVSMFSAILILREIKDSKEIDHLKIGSILMLIGIIILGTTK